jgi:flavin-dependent dehydrogenase
VTSAPIGPRALRSPVVVIGAGPAGCAAGVSLVRNGIVPLLLEKGLRGRDKACGDAWIPEAVQELEWVKVDVRRLASNRWAFSRIDGYLEKRWVWSADYSPCEGVVARRAFVDEWLQDRAENEGCLIWRGARATNLSALGHRLELTVRRGAEAHTLAPSAVILASGSGCRIAREAGLDGKPVFGASISSYISTRGGLPAPGFLFGQPSPGYAWIFPDGARTSNAGVCALAPSATSRLRSQMKTLLQELGADSSVSLRGGLEAMWSGNGSNWRHEAGVVSCGDAAGLVDPTCGERLTGALLSGKRAGAAIASFLAGQLGALAEYSRWVHDWGQNRYSASRENRILAGWVGHAAAERRLHSLLASWT